MKKFNDVPWHAEWPQDPAAARWPAGTVGPCVVNVKGNIVADLARDHDGKVPVRDANPADDAELALLVAAPDMFAALDEIVDPIVIALAKARGVTP